MRYGLVLALVGLSMPAWAVDVYVNGQRVTGVQNLTLQNPSSVRFDAQGNVYVDAPGYRVNAVLPPGPVAPPRLGATSAPDVPRASATTYPDVPRLGRTYFLVTDTNAPGLVQYDVEILIGGVRVRSIDANEAQVIVNLNEFLRPGVNDVVIRATKDLAGGRRGTSNGQVFRVLIGEGTDVQGHVTLETQQIAFVVDASQTAPVSRQYQLGAR